MTKTESANRTVQAVVIEACEQLLECQMSAGARLAIPNTGNLIMVGTQEWIEKNLPGVEAMVEGGELGDDQWIFDLAVDHESRGNGIYGPITFSSTGLVDFVRAVCTRLAATTQASTAQAERVPDGFVLMPKRLTPEMKQAGGHANSEWLNDNAPIGEARYAMPMESIYAALCAAAPAVPVTQEVKR